jgi:hypothetical protein
LLKWLIEEGRERVPAMPDTTREIRLQAAADAPLDDLRADVNEYFSSRSAADADCAAEVARAWRAFRESSRSDHTVELPPT